MTEEDDIISNLPDVILCHILSFLETKQSIATSILSKRRNPLWRSVTSMRFNTIATNQISNFDFNDFVYFVLLSRDATLPINTFHLDAKYDDSVFFSIKTINKWVNFVVRGVEHLYLRVISLSLSLFKLPFTVLTCKTLVVLKLSWINVEQCSVQFRSLKTLHLEYASFPKLRDFILFLTGCPNLEDLLTNEMSFDDELDFDSDEEWDTFSLCNLSRAYIDCFSYYFPLKVVHNVRYLYIEIKEVDLYNDDNIPTFHNLTHLVLNCSDYGWEFLPDVLNHCPKLQRLDLEELRLNDEICAKKADKEKWIFPDIVPQCLSLHLRTCNLFTFLGLHGDLMLARYILKNARVLQSMNIWNMGQPRLKRKLCLFPRASSTCRLTVIKN